MATPIHPMGAIFAGTSGIQDDIFRGQSYEGHWGAGGSPWSGDYYIVNHITNEEIMIPTGVVEYIKRYGFYEGNVPYRIDPLKLVSVLTGVRVADLQAYARSRSS